MIGLSNGTTKCNATKFTHVMYGNPQIRSQYEIKEGDGKLTYLVYDMMMKRGNTLGFCLTERCHSDSTLEAW